MEIYNDFQLERSLLLLWNWRPIASQYAEVSSYCTVEVYTQTGRTTSAHCVRHLRKIRWHTLSLQMPVLEKSAKYFDYLAILPEAFPRIEAGIKHILNSGHHRLIVLLAHSCGAHMAMAWLETTAGRPIDAFIGIGMGATDYRQPMQRPFPFARLKIPVLDIYGSEDYPAVHRLAPIRLEKIQLGGHLGSTQVVVDGADHDFTA